MPKKYPPLTVRQVQAILRALNFKTDRTAGSHEQWESHHSGRRWVVSVDRSERTFDEFLLKSMIKQSGFSREKFYKATPETAKKI